MSWFSRGDKPSALADGLPVATPAVMAPVARPSMWRRVRGVFRRPTAPVAVPVVAAPVAIPVATPAEPPSAVPVAPPKARRSALAEFTAALKSIAGAIDRAFCALAVPFGVHVRDSRRRYSILLGIFACLFVLGAMPLPFLPLIALAAGYVGVLAISRAWTANERRRIAIVKKLEDTDPDSLPDLRWTAFVSALQLLILFPLAFMQLQWHFDLFAVSGPTNFFDWLWFALDKTYLKALPDWSILYGVHISSIHFDKSWGKHLVLLSRLTFDYVLLQGLVRLLATRATIREAVAVIRTDPELAVRVGRRAIPSLVEKLSDPDRAVRGAAANALTQLGDPDAIRQMHEVIGAEVTDAG